MLEKTFDPAHVEARIHEAWERAGAFKAGRADRAGGEPFCIVIPPPNVTGSLHMGHALNNTLQDVLCRFERMRGCDVLWQPGTDHAGIATQMVVERQMMERQEPDRRTIGREAFLRKVWTWKEESGGTIVNQLKRLGASCDWSRERFTMDPGLSQAVVKVFVELYRAGLIYKDKRLVNWDPKFQTAISDLEVEQLEKKGSFKWTRGETAKDGAPVALDHARLGKLLDREPGGHMYYIDYPLVGATYDPANPETFLTVATTRPETMLGDTAVAVHPEHPRYAAWVGRRLVLPLTGRTIPIVADTYADPEKGTGAVKITPAHDFNDFEVGRRHADKLEAPINIFDAFARVNENAPEAYRGLERFEARKKVIADLDAQGRVAKIEPVTQTVPHGDRSGVPIEPWLTDQWYVNAAELAKPAMAAVREGKTNFVPERFAADYFRWLENIQPWCVSRQLWWGHQIPAWYGPERSASGRALGSTLFTAHDPARQSAQAKSGPMFVALSQDEAAAQAREYYGCAIEVVSGPEESVTRTHKEPTICIWRDPDVLDTWFSSALWPFSTLGWPDQTFELARFYPTSVLVTGFDIIFFWVARMMMMGCHFMPDVPFHDVYIHGLVRDEKGQKMSKSKGNVVDPLTMIDEYGADALRFTMAAMASQGSDVKFSTKRIEGYRNFATKLWNAARFAEMNECVTRQDFDPRAAKETINRWIAGETERAAARITEALTAFRYNDAAAAAYEFVWGVFCDWYLELIKPILAGDEGEAKSDTRAMVSWVLDETLKLLHPFMPFITEELWQRTAEHAGPRATLLALAPWPAHQGLADAAADAEIGFVVSLVSEVRSVRSEMNVPAAAKVPLVLTSARLGETRDLVARHEEEIKRLARIDTIGFAEVPPAKAAVMMVGEVTASLPLEGVIDMAAEAKRLDREIAKVKSDLDKAVAWLANPANVEKSPEHVVDLNRERVSEGEAKLVKLQTALGRIGA